MAFVLRVVMELNSKGSGEALQVSSTTVQGDLWHAASHPVGACSPRALLPPFYDCIGIRWLY